MNIMPKEKYGSENKYRGTGALNVTIHAISHREYDINVAATVY